MKFMNIAIIPCRIGSKRIKKKNIKAFYGKPIIIHTINNIIKSKIFEKIIVSSDSLIVKDLLVKHKQIIFHKRQKKYSKDNSTTADAIKSCISDMKIFKNANICCIYPCAPMIDSDDLKKTKKILDKNSDFFITPVKKYSHPIQRSFRLSKSNKIIELNKKYIKAQTQKIDQSYHDVGQFYWGRASTWFKYKSILINSIAYPTNRIEYIDVDDYDDWMILKRIFKQFKNF